MVRYGDPEWGSSFAAAFSAVGEATRAAASAVATGAHWVGKQAVNTYEWSKEQVGKAAEWAKGEWRDYVSGSTDRLFDAVGQADAARESISERLKDAYDKIGSLFGGGDPGDSVVECKAPARSSLDKDGWLMAPAEVGCSAMPPSAGAEAVREQAVLAGGECCEHQRADYGTRDIVYVNGVNTDMEVHCETLRAIAEQTCGRVIGVYNATGGFLRDAVQTSRDRLSVKAASEGKMGAGGTRGRNLAVDSVTNVIIDDVLGERETEIWAHSQGGAISSLALTDAKNQLLVTTGDPNPLSAIHVKSLGSAAPRWPDGPDYEHYVHVNDATPSSFGLGHDGRRDVWDAGENATVVRFSGDPSSAEEFQDEAPLVDMLPSATGHHGVEDTYLRMEKQKNGGCP